MKATNVVSISPLKPHRDYLDASTFSIENDKYCLIPDGMYQVTFMMFKTALMFRNAPKIELWFKVLNHPDYSGYELPKWYNCTKVIKKGKNGKFKVARRSNFSIDFIRLFEYLPGRLDRLPMSYFNQSLFEIETETVTRNFQQIEYPNPLRYSKIKRIVKRLDL